MNVSLGTGARKELGWALVAVVGLVWLGWALENLTGTLLVGSLIYMGWHLANLFQLAFWLQKKNTPSPCPRHLE